MNNHYIHKIFTVFAVAVLISTSAASAQTVSVTNTNSAVTRVVTIDRVNIRRGPSRKISVIRTANIGMAGQVLDTKVAEGITWKYIKYDSGVTGWSAGNYLSSETAPALGAPVKALTVTDFEAPTTPNGFRWGSVTNSSIQLGWLAATDNVGVVGYRIYRGTGDGVPTTLITTTSNVTYTDNGLSANTRYYYNVSAIDAVGNESPRAGLALYTSAAASDAKSLNVPTTQNTPQYTSDTTPPSVPNNLRWSEVSNTSATIGWAPSTDDVGVVGYKIYRSGSYFEQTVLIGQVSETTFNNSGLTSGTNYYYQVSAVDNAGNESQRAGLGLSTTAVKAGPVDGANPSTPDNVRYGTVTASSVMIGWFNSTDDIGVTGYKIYRSGSLDGDYSLLTTVQQNGTPISSFTDTALAANTWYFYQISAVDAAGHESQRAGVGVQTTAQ